MIYLASPYFHPDPHERQFRYDRMITITGQFLAAGHYVYSPIVHCHPLALDRSFPTDFAFWKNYNLHMLDRAKELWVIQLDGWQKSIGVTEEITFAILYGKSIRYFDDGGIESGEDNQHGRG